MIDSNGPPRKQDFCAKVKTFRPATLRLEGAQIILDKAEAAVNHAPRLQFLMKRWKITAPPCEPSCIRSSCRHPPSLSKLGSGFLLHAMLKLWFFVQMWEPHGATICEAAVP